MYFSFHLLATSPLTAAWLLLRRWSRAQPAGLLLIEPMAAMDLGTPIISTRRFRPGRVALFAVWESFDDLDAWLAEDASGRRWAQGWHVRLEFLRVGAKSPGSATSRSRRGDTTRQSLSWR